CWKISRAARPTGGAARRKGGIHGQGGVERRDHRRKRRDRGGRGQPLFPVRGGEAGCFEAERHHQRLPVERHGQLLQRGGGRQGEQGRRLVLPRTQACCF